MKRYTVDRAALAENARLIQEAAAPAKVWAVVKGDGYGLGIGPVAKVLREAGIRRFAVTEPAEAETLRRDGTEEERILMLRATSDPEELRRLIALNVIVTISSEADYLAVSRAAAEQGTVAEAHIKLDTGMGRYGFLPDELEKVIPIYRDLERVAVTGIYTHFACAFCDEKKTRAQYEMFMNEVRALKDAGCSVGEVHCANSAALIRYPEMKCDSVRVGSAFLGRLSVPDSLGLRRIGECEATVEELRRLPKGWSVGYGAGFVTRRATTIAVLGVGYYHGFSVERGRDLFRFSDIVRGIASLIKALITRKKLYVTFGHRRCPVLGHVGMLHTVVDVTGLDVKAGDTAILNVNPLDRKGIPVTFL